MDQRHGAWYAHTDKVSALEVEAVQLVAGLLCVHDVVIDNEGSSLCVGGNALADLTVYSINQYCAWRRERAREVTYRMGPYLPKSSKSSSGVTL